MDEQMMKEKFEHWYSNEGEYPKAIERTGDGKSYIYMGADSAWRAWQACAAALSQPAAQVDSSHSAGGECGGVPEPTPADYMLIALRVTAGNIRSLGPAGAIPEPYKVWLDVVESAIAKATP